MPTPDDVRALAAVLPGAEIRQTMGGAAWQVRNKPFVWECQPWPSVPEPVREILAREPVWAVKLGDTLDARALRAMEPEVFLPQTTVWGEPKVAFRLAAIDAVHLAELIVESWRIQAPTYLRRTFDEDLA